MTVIYYDNNFPKDQLGNIRKQVMNIVKDDVLILPKNFDILLDCSLDQLISVKGILDTAITLRMQMEDAPPTIPQ